MNDIFIEDIEDDEAKINDDIGKKNMKKKNRKKNKKIKKLNIYLLLVTLIWLFLIILNTFLIFKYDVLPLKYLLIYLLVIVFIPILLIYLLTKKKMKKGPKVCISLIGIFYIVVLNFSFFYLNKTFNFLDSFTSGYNYETKNYVVLVLKDSKYKKIENLKNKKMGYVDQTNNKMDKALSKVEEEIKFKSKAYKEYSILLKSLLEKEIDAILLGDAYYEMLKEEEEHFDSLYKVIYRFSLSEKTEEIKKEADVTKDTFNIYLSGIDSYGNVSSLTRSDVNIVVSVNPKTNQILMVNIPRDYYIELHDTNAKDKLTHAGLYGVDMSVQSLEDLLDIEINYYFKVNYNALVKLVNALGGVDVYSKYSFTSVGTDKNYFYKKGYNHVNGTEALYFVRTRKAFQDGDRVRGENQQAMIQAIIKKACSSAILTRYSDILSSLQGSFITNLSTDKITDLVKMQLDKMPSWNITSIGLSGTDGTGFTYTYPYQELYVMNPDEKTVESAKECLEKVKSGEKLESSYTENMGKVNTPTLSNPKTSTKKSSSATTSSANQNSTIEKEETKTEISEKDFSNMGTSLDKNEENNQENDVKNDSINQSSEETTNLNTD